MAEKHVAICDKCGSEALYENHRFPSNWLLVGTPGEIADPNIQPWHFCSKECVGRWALQDALMEAGARG